jgi:flagellar motor switch protein FliN/FliY
MSANSSNSESWLINQWADENARALQSMTDARPAASCEPVAAADVASAFQNGTVYVEVTLSLAPNALIWISVPPAAAQALGQRTLQAAGIDDAGPEEIQNTCLEILQQAHAGLAQAISARLKRAITSKGRETDTIPAANPLFRLTITYADAPPIEMYLSVSAAVLGGLEPPQDTEGVPAPAEDRSSPTAASKTFDVLLDVSMPVSVSFGRTEMAIKEVLKLTTGSIVELNRALTEPVEVIINDRVIARGEVVVVDGNYGVRIHHIVSRQERFRSSTQATMISKSEHSVL